MSLLKKSTVLFDLQDVSLTTFVLEDLLQALKRCSEDKCDLRITNIGEVSFLSIFGGLLREVLHIETIQMPSQETTPTRLSKGSQIILPSGEEAIVKECKSGENEAYYILRIEGKPKNNTLSNLQ